MFEHESDYLVIIWAFNVFAMFDNIKRRSDMHWQTIQSNWQYESRNEIGFFSNNRNICAFLWWIYWRIRDICVSILPEKLCFLFALNLSIFLFASASPQPTKWSNQNLLITNKHTIIFAQCAFWLVLLFIALGLFLVDTVRLFYFIFCLYCSAADYYRSMQIALKGISGNKPFILKKKIQWYKYSTKFTIVTIFLNIFFIKFVKEFHIEFNTNLRFLRKNSSIYDFLSSFESIIC